ncbi:MAG: hypothetical protein VKN72_22490 [Nostocales cyanobacterium 94392]|nr:hypothetical protein [Nostocales cyanobacterium 94392]
MIPKPIRDKQGKVMGEFYPLQKNELIALRKAKLINNTAFVHLALRYENPFCDRTITIIPKQFAKRWFLPESSVYEAIGKLKANNTININSGKFTIEWVDSQQEQDSENSEKFWEPRKNSENSEKILESQKKLRNPRKNSGIPENSPPKSSPDKDYSTSQTIQTYSNFIQTLSEKERASFLEFCREKTKNLSQEVNDLEAWLAHTNKAGQNRWEVYYQNFLDSTVEQSIKSQYHKAIEEWQEELRAKEKLNEDLIEQQS